MKRISRMNIRNMNSRISDGKRKGFLWRYAVSGLVSALLIFPGVIFAQIISPSISDFISEVRDEDTEMNSFEENIFIQENEEKKAHLNDFFESISDGAYFTPPSKTSQPVYFSPEQKNTYAPQPVIFPPETSSSAVPADSRPTENTASSSPVRIYQNLDGSFTREMTGPGGILIRETVPGQAPREIPITEQAPREIPMDASENRIIPVKKTPASRNRVVQGPRATLYVYPNKKNTDRAGDFQQDFVIPVSNVDTGTASRKVEVLSLEETISVEKPADMPGVRSATSGKQGFSIYFLPQTDQNPLAEDFSKPPVSGPGFQEPGPYFQEPVFPDSSPKLLPAGDSETPPLEKFSQASFPTLSTFSHPPAETVPRPENRWNEPEKPVTEKKSEESEIQVNFSVKHPLKTDADRKLAELLSEDLPSVPENRAPLARLKGFSFEYSSSEQENVRRTSSPAPALSPAPEAKKTGQNVSKEAAEKSPPKKAATSPVTFSTSTSGIQPAVQEGLQQSFSSAYSANSEAPPAYTSVKSTKKTVEIPESASKIHPVETERGQGVYTFVENVLDALSQEDNCVVTADYNQVMEEKNQPNGRSSSSWNFRLTSLDFPEILPPENASRKKEEAHTASVRKGLIPDPDEEEMELEKKPRTLPETESVSVPLRSVENTPNTTGVTKNSKIVSETETLPAKPSAPQEKIGVTWKKPSELSSAKKPEKPENTSSGAFPAPPVRGSENVTEKVAEKTPQNFLPPKTPAVTEKIPSPSGKISSREMVKSPEKAPLPRESFPSGGETYPGVSEEEINRQYERLEYVLQRSAATTMERVLDELSARAVKNISPEALETAVDRATEKAVRRLVDHILINSTPLVEERLTSGRILQEVEKKMAGQEMLVSSDPAAKTRHTGTPAGSRTAADAEKEEYILVGGKSVRVLRPRMESISPRYGAQVTLPERAPAAERISSVPDENRASEMSRTADRTGNRQNVSPSVNSLNSLNEVSDIPVNEKTFFDPRISYGNPSAKTETERLYEPAVGNDFPAPGTSPLPKSENLSKNEARETPDSIPPKFPEMAGEDVGFVKISGKKNPPAPQDENPPMRELYSAASDTASPKIATASMKFPEIPEENLVASAPPKREPPYVAALEAPRVAALGASRAGTSDIRPADISEMEKSDQPVPDPRTFHTAVPLCDGILLNMKSNVARIQVADPSVCDTVAVSPNQISIIGKKPGETILQLTFLDPQVQNMTIVASVSGDSPEGSIRSRWAAHVEGMLRRDVRGCNVSIIQLKNRLFLKGHVTSEADIKRVVSLVQTDFQKLRKIHPEIITPRAENAPYENAMIVNMLIVRKAR